ncbi:hypothetical protein EUGRSUZ_I01826 [Eucalyptus grandis]|uniref:Uncharacterized protein n=2 Tax=Eucalyptus grandis TaxID=71139 RepID=A0ACC3JG70_EUCGR|nr:hypothetical protein EUGRSUZ_I01826 [Eucalyptus grandis]
MDTSCIGFVGILREVLRIPTASPRFLILAFLSSFPLFCSLLLNEFLLQQTFLDAAHLGFDGTSEFSASSDSPGFGICDVLGPTRVLKRWVEEASRGLVLMSALYLVIANPLDLLNSMMVVHNASAIYAGDDPPNLRQFFIQPLKRIGFRGPLVTSMYSLLLSCLTLLVIVSFASGNLCGLFSPFGLGRFASALVLATSFTKYLEWSVIWNVGIVISILEEKQGDTALAVAAYLSRGSRRKGVALMLVFFICRLALRLSCLYIARHGRGSGLVASTVVQVCLMCLGNVVKWSVFTVYYCDCKQRFLKKKTDVEEGKADPPVKS